MKRVYIIGDSISYYYRPFLEKLLWDRLEQLSPEVIAETNTNLNKAHGAIVGDSSKVLALLQEKRKAGGINADLLLLNCGLHDIKTTPATGQKQVPLDQYRQNLQAIVPLVREMGLQLVWVRTTPVDDKTHNTYPDMEIHRFAADCHAYNTAADEIMRAAGVPIIDLHNFTLNLGGNLFLDHVHFPPPICQQQAAYIAGWVSAFTHP